MGDFCDSKRDYDRNRNLCRHLGFRRSVTDEEWALMAETVEEFLPEDYAMLVEEVANNLESSSGDEYDPEEEDEDEDLSPSTYESFDSEDSEDSADLYDSEDDSEDSYDIEEVVKKDDKSKKSKKSNKKKSKKSNKKKSKKSNKRKRSSCDDRSKSSCKDKRSCEWVTWHKGKNYCRRRYTDESSDYDFESASEDFYSEY